MELRALQRRVGITFLMVTHDKEEALTLADRITVMNHGRVEQTASPQQIYLSPATPFVAEFLGAINWFDGIGLRPEATRISPEPPLAGQISFTALIRSSTFLGNCVHIEAEMPGGELIFAEVSRYAGKYKRGDRVHVSWDPADELRFL